MAHLMMRAIYNGIYHDCSITEYHPFNTSNNVSLQGGTLIYCSSWKCLIKCCTKILFITRLDTLSVRHYGKTSYVAIYFFLICGTVCRKFLHSLFQQKKYTSYAHTCSMSNILCKYDLLLLNRMINYLLKDFIKRGISHYE